MVKVWWLIYKTIINGIIKYTNDATKKDGVDYVFVIVHKESKAKYLICVQSKTAIKQLQINNNNSADAIKESVNKLKKQMKTLTSVRNMNCVGFVVTCTSSTEDESKEVVGELISSGHTKEITNEKLRENKNENENSDIMESTVIVPPLGLRKFFGAQFENVLVCSEYLVSWLWV